ncbi:hypothetical protein C7293_23400 [filamentous cyanobacterium CCT1]|nr:hypothetical protein C7293_23400 [filamentous cyanobacterium CCT1]PSN78453.1 hypothetical protein C8B47_16825 [filamentous cyanobacterium CCP4]
MKLLRRQVWINFLGLLPGSLVTVLAIAVAFLRFYDQKDFRFLSVVAQPQLWSNRLTVAALLAALVNFGVEWNRRNREGDRETEAREREARRDRQEARRDRQEVRYRKAQLRYQLDPSDPQRRELDAVLAALEEYEQTLGEAIST